MADTRIKDLKEIEVIPENLNGLLFWDDSLQTLCVYGNLKKENLKTSNWFVKKNRLTRGNTRKI